jgi:hypothetical protein
MKRAAIPFLLICLASINACTTIGNGRMKVLTQKGTGQLLVPGQTSRVEVERSLGQGKSFHFDSGYEVWVYEYEGKNLPQWINHVPVVGVVTTYLPRRSTERELRILFDQKGIVKKWLLLDVPPT